MPSIPDIFCVSKHVAQSCDVDAQHVIAIDSVGCTPLNLRAPSALQLTFNDSEDPTVDHAATPIDIVRLIHFCKHVSANPGTVLIHCDAGISRSTAAALVLIAVLLKPGDEQAAGRVLQDKLHKAEMLGLRTNQDARPNRWLIHLADALLNREGRLTVAAHRAFNYGAEYHLNV